MLVKRIIINKYALEDCHLALCIYKLENGKYKLSFEAIAPSDIILRKDKRIEISYSFDLGKFYKIVKEVTKIANKIDDSY